jgi:1,4-alpha-glucan branching enzyme
VYRKHHHHDITFSMIYAFTENFILPFSHDEVVHGKGHMLNKMPGDLWQKFANVRLLYTYMYMHPGKKLLFMGCEIGQWDEWNCMKSLDWHLLQYEPHQKLQYFMSELNRVYRSNPCLYQIDFSWEGFEWIDLHDHDQSTLSFVRKGADPRDVMVCAFNFTPVSRGDYRLGVPQPGQYEQVLNSDSEAFGGSNFGQIPEVWSEEWGWHGRYHSIKVAIPPLGAVVYRLRR